MLDLLRDQNKLAAKMADYSNPRDPTLVQLFNLVENSKDDAAAQVNFSNLQKYIFKKELSDRAWREHSLHMPVCSFHACMHACMMHRPYCLPFPPSPHTFLLCTSTPSAVLDFDLLGFNGQEPPFLDAYRNKVKKMAPGLFDNIVKDPIMRKYMDNPFAVRLGAWFRSFGMLAQCEVGACHMSGLKRPRRRVVALVIDLKALRNTHNRRR